MPKTYKIIDALCYVPTEDIILDLAVSLPPQMARYLKDVFGPRVAPAIGITAEELYQMKISMSEDKLRETLAPKMRPMAPRWTNSSGSSTKWV